MFIKIIKFFILFIFFSKISFINANSEETFNSWLESYKKFALKKGISQETLDLSFKNVKFLDQVIKYDRKQPEFFEDTITYVSKRANLKRVKNATILKIIDLESVIDKKFLINLSLKDLL